MPFQFLSGFISTSISDKLFDELKEIKHYESGSRWSAAMSDDPDKLTLEGAKTRLSSRGWTTYCHKFKHTLNKKLNLDLNFVLINHYDGPRNHISYHSDSEINSDKLIVSVSLGSSRIFRVYNKDTCEVTDYPVHHGDVIIMSGDFNTDHMHCVPPGIPQDDKWGDYRINLTYRKVYETKIRGAPPKPFATPRQSRFESRELCGFEFIERNKVKPKDIKWKRWGSIGSYTVLDSKGCQEERKKSKAIITAAPDFYLRCDDQEDVMNTLQKMKKVAQKYFPRGYMFRPPITSMTQFMNFYRWCSK